MFDPKTSTFTVPALSSPGQLGKPPAMPQLSGAAPESDSLPDRPVILIDSREQTPLTVKAFQTRRVTLLGGDFGILGMSPWHEPGAAALPGKPLWEDYTLGFAVERKSLSDLLASWGSGRERESRKWQILRCFDFAAYLIEADRAQIERASEGWALGAMIRRGDVDRAALKPYERAALEAADQLAAMSQINPASILATEAMLQTRFGIQVMWGGSRSNCAVILEAWVAQYCAGLWAANRKANGAVRRVKERTGEK